MQDHIKKYLEVRKSGHNAIAKCPFHSDSSPSLYIYPNNYHCFACKAHGNVIDFEMHQKNSSFREAVIELGRQYNIEIVFEKEVKHDFAKEKLTQLFYKTDGLQAKLKEEFIKHKETNLSRKLQMCFPEVGFLPELSLLKEWGCNEKISLAKHYQTSFYTLPFQTEKSEIFGFYFVCCEEKLELDIPVEKHSFTLIFSDRFQPVLNFPQARRHVHKKFLAVTNNLFDLCFLLQRDVQNTVFVAKSHLSEGLCAYFSKYISKLYFVLGSEVNFSISSERVKIFVRWVPSQISEKLKEYQLLNGDSIHDWLMSSEKSNNVSEKQQNFSKKIKNRVKTEQSNVFLKTSRFYNQILLQPSSTEAIEYLKNRGIGNSEIDEWLLGFCPGESALTGSILKHNLDIKVFTSVELLRFSNKTNRYYDFFYNRLIIPIMNHTGEYVALGGRILHGFDTKTPKYINSAESPLFSKSKILFNFFRAADAIIKSGYVIVVEGFMDCIMLCKHGFRNTVAVMGTALTPEHLAALSNITNRVVLCFDSDAAGKQAVQKSFNSNFKHPYLNLEVLNLPLEKDPDAFVRMHGAERFANLLAESTTSIDDFVLTALQMESSDTEDFVEKLKHLLKYSILDPESLLGRQFKEKLQQKYDVNFNLVFPKSSIREIVEEQKQSDAALSSESLSEYHAPIWNIRNPIEIKILIFFFYTQITDLPMKFKNLLLEIESEKETEQEMFKEAFLHQISEIGRSIIHELFVFCINRNYYSCDEILESDLKNLSYETSVFTAFLKSYSGYLLKEGLSFLLDQNSQMTSRKNKSIDFTHLWSLKNLSFLKLQCKNVELAKKSGNLAAILIELLAKLEIDEIDSQLQAYSRSHFNHEISENFSRLMQARSIRQLLLIGYQQ